MPRYPQQSQTLARVLRSPILTNPTKWLYDVPRKHSHELSEERDIFYNRQHLHSNPFAQALIRTRPDSGWSVVPEGISIPLAASKAHAEAKQEQKKKKKKQQICTLSPVLQDDKVDSTRSPLFRGIINNKRVIEDVKEKNKFIARFRSFLVWKMGISQDARPELAPDMAGLIETHYRSKIQEMLELVGDELEPRLSTRQRDGILCTSVGGLSQWRDDHLEVNKSAFGLENDKFVEFEKHPELAKLLVAYAGYHSNNPGS
ncbi:uncharacterized protein LODBEIA_P45000 [Lodderomyces beijingensis]|uniref:Uncharacterized protein n=1 Tax=Lodderomyces beijingensis TaxID=1775926 RepID=A0ABP0ZTH5_9ASCO